MTYKKISVTYAYNQYCTLVASSDMIRVVVRHYIYTLLGAIVVGIIIVVLSGIFDRLYFGRNSEITIKIE